MSRQLKVKARSVNSQLNKLNRKGDKATPRDLRLARKLRAKL